MVWTLIAVIGLSLAALGDYCYGHYRTCQLMSENLQTMYRILAQPNLSAWRRRELEEWREQLLQQRVRMCG